ncbi:MAG: LysR substrate-binding domain-containing protein [Pseudomonadota bacterium]
MNVNLPTDLLRSLITVSDLGGYTKAAEALNRSQPAISLQMRRLEEIVGTKLIINDGKRLKFTEAGIKLSSYARQILHLNDDVISHFRPSDVAGTLIVGLPTDYAVSYLQEAVANFAKQHRETELEIYCDVSENLLKSLHADQANLVVALVADNQNHYLVNAWEEQPVWAVGKKTVVDTKKTIPLIGHFENCPYRKRMTQAFKRKGYRWRISYTSPDISGVQDAVEAGFGVTALTRATMTPKMRLLTEADGFPTLEKIRIGLFYKLPRVSPAGRELANKLVQQIDMSTDKHFQRSAQNTPEHI